jgi:hypothetical protein
LSTFPAEKRPLIFIVSSEFTRDTWLVDKYGKYKNNAEKI